MSRRWLGLLAALTGVITVDAQAQPAGAPAAATCAGTLVYVGSHGSGPGQGIFAACLDRATGALTGLGLAAEIERPTWLVRDPHRPILYTVSETGNDGKSQGGVYSLSIDPKTGKLTTISRTASGGGGATHLAYDARLGALFVANFGGGQVSSIPVQADGGLGAVSSVQTDYGSGPSRRQTGPHAHAVVVDPSGHFVLAPDLGADRVFVYRYDAATKQLSPAAEPFAALPPGSGPRHLVFSRDGRFAFLDTELSGDVYGFRWDAHAGRLTQISRRSIDPSDFTGQKSAAEIVISADGRFLYVSDRGANSLIVYAVDAKTGALSEVQRIAGGGDVPWSFAIDPSGRWLIVANEASSTLAVFGVDRASGKLTATPSTLSAPKPVSIAYFQP